MKERKGIFETNSSSTHSCVICEDGKLLDSLPVDKTGAVSIQFGEYGWERETYTDASTKASYALTLLYGTQCDWEGNKLVSGGRKDYFGMFEGVVMNQTGARFIKLIGANGRELPAHASLKDFDRGYVDHQSVDDMFSDIFASEKSLRNFIFNKSSVLETDSDG